MEWTIPAFAFPAEAGTHLPTPEDFFTGTKKNIFTPLTLTLTRRPWYMNMGILKMYQHTKH